MAPSATTGATADKVRPIETLHEDMIHDAQLDYYGKRLATCSSDRTVKVFDVVDGSASGQGTTLRGHEGPVWQVAWAHPKFGPILASASYDGKVFIWKDSGSGVTTQAGGYSQHQGYGAGAVSSGGWTKIKEHAAHSASVNSIAWAPHELGSVLACASSDGNVSVLAFNDDGSWGLDVVAAHPMGCNAVSWAPSTVPGSLITAQSQQPGGQVDKDSSQNSTVRRFASAGCDNIVKIWEYSQDSKKWEEVEQLTGHTDWVRDVAFAPNIGLPRSYLATCSQDRTVLIWTQDNLNSPWIKTSLTPPPPSTSTETATSAAAAPGSENKFAETVWRVSWSVSGNVLAVSCGDGKVTLWKENLKGAWECCSELDS
ncbi:unnamed protein product [Sympodiomycopsis kandeliae]